MPSSVLPLENPVIKRGEGAGIPLTIVTLPHFFACPKPWPGFPMSYAWFFFLFNDLRWEVIVCFVDIGWIVDHHCSNLIFIVIYLLTLIIGYFVLSLMVSWLLWIRVVDMVFNATLNNISVISWRSVLLVEETGVPEDNHQLAASYWQTLLHNVVSSTPRHERDLNSQH